MARALGVLSIAALANANAGAQAGVPSKPDYFVVGGGYSGVLRGDRIGNGVLEYRWHQNWHGIYPKAMLGFASHAHFIAVAAAYNFELGGRVRLGISTGPGYYERDKFAPDLGSELEFISAVELSVPIYKRQRIAVAFAHISNANLAPHNPGSELLQVLYQFAID